MEIENKNKGFTLLEMTMAVFIVIVGLVGVYGVFANLNSQASLNSSKLIAVYLAQEGMELVRNIRDENWLNDVAWDNGLTDCQLVNNKFCEIDYDNTGLTDYDASIYEGTILNIDNNNYYSYNLTTKPTKYKRKITIAPAGGNRLDVFTEVEWQEAGASHSVKVGESLYNWK